MLGLDFLPPAVGSAYPQPVFASSPAPPPPSGIKKPVTGFAQLGLRITCRLCRSHGRWVEALAHPPQSSLPAVHCGQRHLRVTPRHWSVCPLPPPSPLPFVVSFLLPLSSHSLLHCPRAAAFEAAWQGRPGRDEGRLAGANMAEQGRTNGAAQGKPGHRGERQTRAGPGRAGLLLFTASDRRTRGFHGLHRNVVSPADGTQIVSCTRSIVQPDIVSLLHFVKNCPQ